MTPLYLRIRPTAHVNTRFQLVDEWGAGEPYAGLAYEAIDPQGDVQHGLLDAEGRGLITGQMPGLVVLRFTHAPAAGHITELQVRAEHTLYVNQDGARTRHNPAKKSSNADFVQVEVRHLVEHVSHLPPLAECHNPPAAEPQQWMQARGQFGVCVVAGRCTVLEVRPLRALSPMFSVAKSMCTLNLYQMALMAAADNCPFAQARTGSDPQAYRPLYEDVAYSKRLQVAPQSTEHVLIAHNDDLLLIALRGPHETADFWANADRHQVPFAEGKGHVHDGFYQAAKHAYACVEAYLATTGARQNVLVCGHGVNGAVGLILSQMLHSAQHKVDVQLYTYGAPRAADAAFVNAAESLVHYRMVNHHDPLPSLPGSWMNTPRSAYDAGAVLGFTNVPPQLGVFVAGLSQLTGELYQHHGSLCHFMPIEIGQDKVSHVMWAPTSDIVTQHALSRAVFEQPGDVAVGPLLNGEHAVGLDRYIARCWLALRGAQKALEVRRSLVTEAEVRLIDQAFERIAQQLRARYQSVMAQPDKDAHVQERSINWLMRELCRVHTTRKRLCGLRFKVPSAADVYGTHAQSPQALAQNLERWLAGDRGVRSEQLTMASAS